MVINSNIGKWIRYPEKRQLFEATIFVYFHDQNTLNFLVNVSPDFPLSEAYGIKTSLTEFKAFIEGLYNGRNLNAIQEQGFFKRKFQVKGKYAFSEVTYLWKIPISYTMFTVTPQAVSSLYRDFCQT